MGSSRLWYLSRAAACLAGCVASAALGQNLNTRTWDGPIPALMTGPGGALLSDHVTCGGASRLRGYLAAGLQPDGTPMVQGSPLTGGDDGSDFGTREAATATDLQHCKLEIELIPSSGTKNIIGKNTMTVRSLVNGLTQFTFRLRTQYAVTALKVDGVTATATTPPANSYARVITLPHAYNTGDVFTIEINYEGLAVNVFFGSIEFGSLNGNTSVFTLSEPYYAATWWPVKDGDVFQPGDNSDKFTAEIWITSPSAMTSVSNGLLQGTDALSGSRTRYRWQTNYPIATYLVFIGSTTYNTWTRPYDYPGGTMTCQFYLSPASDSAGQRADWEKSIPMMETFRTMGGLGGYGLYPFINEKYGIYHFTFGGGMEHQTCTGQLAPYTSESLTSHELSHQWWGDNVTCRTWSDIWLNEGFATYSECLWAQYKAGSSGWPAYFSAINARNPGAGAGTVYKANTADPNWIFDGTTSYHKGGWVLHMLRHVVGETAFWAIFQQYRATYEGSGATTNDFFNVCAAVTGTDLTYFKNEWVMGTGSPTYQYGWQTALLNGQNYLRLYINQTQTASYGTYAMPIDIRVTTGAGTITPVAFNTADPQHFLIPIPAAATAVTLDPDGWILNGGKTSTTYVQGPPKIIALTPDRNADYAPGTPPSSIKVVFSDNVTTAASDYVVLRDGLPFSSSFSYNAGTFTTTLDSSGPLPAGAYSVTVRSTVRSAVGAIALDGELTVATLPSGDGLAGGDGVYTFNVQFCPSDYNHDGFVDGIDYDQFNNDFESPDPVQQLNADFNNDGFVDGIDYDQFNNAFAVGC